MTINTQKEVKMDIIKQRPIVLFSIFERQFHCKTLLFLRCSFIEKHKGSFVAPLPVHRRTSLLHCHHRRCHGAAIVAIQSRL